MNLYNQIKHFSKKDLPFNKLMKSFWNENGFLIIDNFYSNSECDNLKLRALELVKNFDPYLDKSIFDTKDQNIVKDKYFIDSGDKIRFFFEQGAFDKDGSLKNSVELLINKIGHAIHDLDPIFYKFSHKKDLQDIANGIDITNPKLLQSMYIFKQPKIGGEVVPHQDSTFIYTKPESVVGFWVALEDATKDNGCMLVNKGGHKDTLRKIFKKKNDELIMETLDEKPFKKMDTILEAKKGTLILLHGRLPHASSANTSTKSRHAYTLHVINGDYEYPKFNWLQRSKNMPLKGFEN